MIRTNPAGPPLKEQSGQPSAPAGARPDGWDEDPGTLIVPPVEKRSGIGWVLGRYDRPWGPERPVYGTIRYMSSANTARKMDVTGYLRRFGPPSLF